MHTIFQVEGMTCGHCVQAVSNALSAIPGVNTVKVDLEKGMVSIEGNADEAAMRSAIEEEGYEVK